jgi:hypothetical protein
MRQSFIGETLQDLHPPSPTPTMVQSMVQQGCRGAALTADDQREQLAKRRRGRQEEGDVGKRASHQGGGRMAGPCTPPPPTTQLIAGQGEGIRLLIHHCVLCFSFLAQAMPFLLISWKV